MREGFGRTTVYLLRHGPTEWNAERRIMGRRPIPLSPDGLRQVRVIGTRLAGLGIGSIWTSPVLRARETADRVSHALGAVPVHDLPDLAEVDYADWEGKLFSDLVDDPVFREHLVDPLGSRAPGGGENLVEVGGRMMRALDTVTRGGDGQPVLLVSHGDPLRMLVAGCIGLDAIAMRRLRIDPGGLSALSLGGPWPELAFLNRRLDEI